MKHTKSLFIFISLISMIFLTTCESQKNISGILLSELWERHWGSENNDIAEDLVIIGDNIFITGVTLGEMDGNKSTGEWDIFLTKYNLDGNYKWTKQWGTTGRDCGTGISADSTGIYITGYVKGSLDGHIDHGSYDIFLTKFNFTGTKLWTIQVGTKGDDRGLNLTVDSSGIYITGFTEGNLAKNSFAGKSDIFLMKFSTEGIWEWTRQWGSKNVEWGQDISICTTGIYITGHTQGVLSGNQNFGFDDIFLTKFSLNGDLDWTRQWGTDGNDEGNSIVTNSTGIYIAGRVNGDLDGSKRIKLDDIFLTRYNPTGEKQWTKILGTRANDNAFAMTMSDNSVFITGVTCGEFEENKSLGACDTYIAGYSFEGERQWIKQIGTGGFDFGRSIELKGSDIYLSGDSSFGIDGTSNEGSNRDALLMKWGFH